MNRTEMIVLLIFLYALVITIQFVMEEKMLNMKNFWSYIKKNWKTILLVALVLFLLWLIFRPAGNGPDVKDDRSVVDSLTAVIQVNDMSHRDFVRKKEREVDSLRSVTIKTQYEAQKARTEIRRLIARGSGVIALAPSPVREQRNFDSLATAFEDLSLTAVEYIKLVDTITVQYQAQLDAKDSIISRQLKLYSDLRTAHLEISGKYYSMEKNYLRAEKKRKINRDLNRGLAAAVLILGAIVAKK